MGILPANNPCFEETGFLQKQCSSHVNNNCTVYAHWC